VVDAANETLVAMFGENIAKHAQAVFIRESTVTIACMNAPVAQEIKLRETEFLRRLKEKPFSASAIDRVAYLLDERL
jgi:hypothetical protein